ncbi:CheR family methyltransferase [Chloroflexus sp.]|uniref:CheR family methyltransferase n=1 Tax=Chloroflexus sp. TaxID=1904827 RepID=UPI002625F641|nr:CheR family methyltransferase [uncultured Chloroflexus sp.]
MTLSPESLSPLRDLLARYCGVLLDEARLITLRSAVERRSAVVGRAPAQYLADLTLSADRHELQQLAELLLNHETVFFRNRPHMEALRKTLLPELHARLPPGAPIKIWSAGCATGEEPYSIAITALEALGDPLPRPVEILATDLSAAALAKARQGVYRGRTLTNLTPAQRLRFFTLVGDGLAVQERVRQLVTFTQHNLLEPFPPAVRGTHILFCQNVTIYFSLDTCRALMGRFYEILTEGGTLCLGFSETLWNIFDRLRPIAVDGAFLYRKDPPRQRSLPESGGKRTAQPRMTRPRHTGSASRQSALFTDETVVSDGRRLIESGQIDAALDLFARAPLAGRHAPAVLALAAQAHANRGDLDLALAEARRTLELNPLVTEAHLLLGLIYERQQQLPLAIRHLERARYLSNDSPIVAFHLAECYRQTGRVVDAIREYRNAERLLAGLPPDQVLEGVAIHWLTESCRRWIVRLEGER